MLVVPGKKALGSTSLGDGCDQSGSNDGDANLIAHRFIDDSPKIKLTSGDAVSLIIEAA
jgi:hypothetical protein